MYSLLRGRTVSEKLPKIPLFGPSLIHQSWLLGSQQHPQIWVLLTSFSTWGTENSLVTNITILNFETRTFGIRLVLLESLNLLQLGRVWLNYFQFINTIMLNAYTVGNEPGNATKVHYSCEECTTCRNCTI